MSRLHFIVCQSDSLRLPLGALPSSFQAILNLFENPFETLAHIDRERIHHGTEELVLPHHAAAIVDEQQRTQNVLHSIGPRHSSQGQLEQQ